MIEHDPEYLRLRHLDRGEGIVCVEFIIFAPAAEHLVEIDEVVGCGAVVIQFIGYGIQLFDIVSNDKTPLAPLRLRYHAIRSVVVAFLDVGQEFLDLRIQRFHVDLFRLFLLPGLCWCCRFPFEDGRERLIYGLLLCLRQCLVGKDQCLNEILLLTGLCKIPDFSNLHDISLLCTGSPEFPDFAAYNSVCMIPRMRAHDLAGCSVSAISFSFSKDLRSLFHHDRICLSPFLE